MNFKTEFFLAGRFLKPGRNAVSVITVISLLGVTLGVAVLIVVLSVFTGFTNLMREKLLDSRAHMQIYTTRLSVIAEPDEVVKAVNETGGVAMPVIGMPILLRSAKTFVPKRILGVDPKIAAERFKFKIVDGAATLPPSGQVWISEEIAGEQNFKVGDTIYLFTPEQLSDIAKTELDGGASAGKINARASLFTIGGIYSMGKYDFDKEMILMTRADSARFLRVPPSMATSVFAWFPDPFHMDREQTEILAKLESSRQQYQIYTWQRLNAPMFGMLQSQKSMMMFIFFFIILIAAFSIGNTLITVVVQKGREIGLMKALGATPNSMMRVFVWQGLLVGIAGSLGGVILGMVALALRNDFMRFLEKLTGWELFPREMYFFDELPAHTGAWDVVIIAAMAVVLCTIGALLPAWRAARLDPAKALRDE